MSQNRNLHAQIHHRVDPSKGFLNEFSPWIYRLRISFSLFANSPCVAVRHSSSRSSPFQPQFAVHAPAPSPSFARIEQPPPSPPAGRHVKIRADLLCGRLPQREVAATPAAIDRVLTAAQIAFSTELVHTIPIHTKQEILLPLTAQPHLPPLFTTRRCPICLSYWCKVLEVSVEKVKLMLCLLLLCYLSLK
ncbi:uncharacterized protein LOC121784079 [Salvia splendens]|uniref:uncharacterized protein LOC121784079 n=1 Tax=Salvia splendens TaxID=180675 RepID=UPI001C262F3F|nr:uncharacterized protein LOC121784079 [Salvia splendens]